MEREQAIKFMLDLLKLLKQKNGSDLFITVGFPPAMKIDGKVTPVSKGADRYYVANLAIDRGRSS